MKQLTCEMCGGTDLLKDGGVFVCQSCGTKYSVEEAKKMMVEGTVDVKGEVKIDGAVRVDTSAELKNLYQIARRAKDDNNSENAAKYYDMILIKDPTSWEASFYTIYFKAMSCKIGEIQSAAISIGNCINSVLSLIKDNLSEEEREDAYCEVTFRTRNICQLLYRNAKSTYKESSYDGSVDDFLNRTKACETALQTLADKIITIFSDSILAKDLATYALNDIIEMNIYPAQNLNRELVGNAAIRKIEICFDNISTIRSVYDKNKNVNELLIAANNDIKSGNYFAAISRYDLTEKKGHVSPVCILLKSVFLCNPNLNSSYQERLLYAEIKKAISLPIEEIEKESLRQIINIRLGLWSYTFLIIAAIFEDFRAVELFVNLGADVNASQNLGETALWQVCHKPCRNPIEGRKIAKLLIDKGANLRVKDDAAKIALYNCSTDPEIAAMIRAKDPSMGDNSKISQFGGTTKSGCYVATCVYGSYDCPEVWTLRRYRDYTLAETWYGRAFIHTYYAISPTIVKWFGNTEWFKKMWKGKLDRMVENLQSNGVENTPYEDKKW